MTTKLTANANVPVAHYPADAELPLAHFPADYGNLAGVCAMALRASFTHEQPVHFYIVSPERLGDGAIVHDEGGYIDLRSLRYSENKTEKIVIDNKSEIYNKLLKP